MLECAFESLLLESLKRTIIQAKLISHDHFTVLSLVCKCGALKIGDYVLGSKKKPIFYVMVCPDIADKLKVNLPKIEFFFVVTFVYHLTVKMWSAFGLLLLKYIQVICVRYGLVLPQKCGQLSLLLMCTFYLLHVSNLVLLIVKKT